MLLRLYSPSAVLLLLSSLSFSPPPLVLSPLAFSLSPLPFSPPLSLSLSSPLELDHGLSEPQIRCISKQMFDALAFLHDRGCIHRDIKAGNILLCQNGTIRLGESCCVCCMFTILCVDASATALVCWIVSLDECRPGTIFSSSLLSAFPFSFSLLQLILACLPSPLKTSRNETLSLEPHTGTVECLGAIQVDSLAL